MSVAPVYHLAFHRRFRGRARVSRRVRRRASGTARERARYSSSFVSLSSFLFPCRSQTRRNASATRFSVSLSLSLAARELPSSPLRRRFKRETADSRPFNRVAKSPSREVSRWRPPGGFLVVYVPHNRRPGEYPVVPSGSVGRRREPAFSRLGMDFPAVRFAYGVRAHVNAQRSPCLKTRGGLSRGVLRWPRSRDTLALGVESTHAPAAEGRQRRYLVGERNSGRKTYAEVLPLRLSFSLLLSRSRRVGASSRRESPHLRGVYFFIASRLRSLRAFTRTNVTYLGLDNVLYARGSRR